TDPDREPAFADEGEEVVVEAPTDLVGEDRPRAEVVAKGEAADERDDRVVREALAAAAIEEIEEGNLLRRSTRETERRLGLGLAVESEAGNHEDGRPTHGRAPPCRPP